MNNKKIVRTPFLANKIIFIDGLEGCGKTLFSTLVSSFSRVEKLTYSYEIEHICTLLELKKIDVDAAVTMIKMLTDLILYNTMMSREVNFRPSDLSSVFKHHNLLKYIKRAFLKGDASVPDRIIKEDPILALTVHKLLLSSKPIFSALQDRVCFIEIVRHPLYMIIQQTYNNENLIYSARDFVIYMEHNNTEIPWYCNGWEDKFINSNPVEKSIYYIERLTSMTEKAKNQLEEKYKKNILTIPFEDFVINPNSYMKKMESLFNSKITRTTSKELKRQKVPRKKYADGLSLNVYKRFGWKPSKKSSNEKMEFELRRNFAKETASESAMKVLDNLCGSYEEKYLGGKIIKNGSYIN